MTVAELYPARTDTNGTTWYRSGAGAQDGWTAQLKYADPSYTTTTDEGTDMTALTDDFEEYHPPRFTEWMRYPLPPEPPRPPSKFNGWRQYLLPSPTTG